MKKIEVDYIPDEKQFVLFIDGHMIANLNDQELTQLIAKASAADQDVSYVEN